MDTMVVKSAFGRIGARVRFGDMTATQELRFRGASLVLDVRKDKAGEFFDLSLSARLDAEVVVRDVRAADRHLLLEVRQEDALRRYLCGHDERHFFVSELPANRAASSVFQAKEALKPQAVVEAQRRVKTKHRHKRRAPARNPVIRQGEWFFVPAPEVNIPEALALRNEPIRRGGGTPHVAELLFRTGGTLVYVNSDHPNGLTQDEYEALLQQQPQASRLRWQVMRRDADVFVKGRIRHPDHATIVLDHWYRLVPNAEAPRHLAFVAFLD